MNRSPFRNARGITLIELLIAFAIFALVSGASYRLFVAQSKAYAVQDQVGEIQQNIRAAMELVLRDIRMAGYNSTSLTSQITINNPILPGAQAITVSYQYDDTTQYTVAYWRDNATSTLFHQLTATKPDGSIVAGTGTPDALLNNVAAFSLSYGIDCDAAGNQDGMVDYWETDPTQIGSKRVVAVQIQLIENPDPANPDVQKVVSKRTLTSIVALRNLTFTP